MKKPKFIMADCHQVVEQMYKPNMLVCLRCGLRGECKDLFGSMRCDRYMALSSGGWLDVSTPEERIYLDRFEKRKYE